MSKHKITKALQISSLKHSLVAEYIQQIIKCCNPHDGFIYFANTFAKCVHPAYGVSNLNLYEFQQSYLKNIHNEQFSVNMLGRQMGKSLATAVYIAWRLIFLDGQTVAVTGLKHRDAQEILNKVRFILDNCPDWLKPRYAVNNKNQLQLSNGSKVIAITFEPNYFKGHALNFLYVDEVEGMPIHKVNELLEGIAPTMANSGGHIAMTSSHWSDSGALKTLWDISKQKGAMLSSFKAEWSEHPDRDDAWKNSIVKQIGQAAFEKEHGCIFNTLTH
jgi:hypothetical protein